MARARITGPKGLKIQIEGTPAEVSQILSILRGPPGATGGEKRQPAVGKGERFKGAAGVIVELNAKGFFNKPKSLPEIRKALAAKGAIYPITSLSGIVLTLVRKRVLGRVKHNKKWAYVRR